MCKCKCKYLHLTTVYCKCVHSGYQKSLAVFTPLWTLRPNTGNTSYKYTSSQQVWDHRQGQVIWQIFIFGWTVSLSSYSSWLDTTVLAVRGRHLLRDRSIGLKITVGENQLKAGHSSVFFQQSRYICENTAVNVILSLILKWRLVKYSSQGLNIICAVKYKTTWPVGWLI